MSNKTSDKNVEDDVKILEKDLFYYDEIKENYDVDTVKFYEALRHILSDYTRQKQINEEHKKLNGELRERVKELEEERQLVGMLVKNKRDGRIGIVLHQWENGSIAVLERINPRIINTHDSWNTLEIITDEVKQIQTQDNSIPTQKVIDKIKELKLSGGSDGKDNVENLVRELTIDILQELLGGEK